MNRNITVLFFGNILLALTRWSFYVASLKILDPRAANYATEGMTLGLAIVGPAFILFGGGFRHVVAAQSFQYEEFLSYLYARARAGICAMFLCLLTVFILGRIGFAGTVFAVGLFRFADAMSEMIYGQLQSRHEFVTIGLFKSCRAIVATTVFVLLVYSGVSFLPSLVTTALSCWMVFLILELPYVQFHKKNSDLVVGMNKLSANKNRNRGKCLKNGSVTLGVSMAISAAGTGLPVLFLSAYGNGSHLAVYGTLFCFIAAQQLIFVSYGQYLLPQFAQRWRDGSYKEVHTMVLRASLNIIFSAGLMAASAFYTSDFVLTRLYNENFFGYGTTLASLLCAGGLIGVYATFGASLTAVGVLQSQLYVSGIYLATNALCLFCFGYNLTLEGVAFSLAAASAAAAVAACIIRLRYQSKFDNDPKKVSIFLSKKKLFNHNFNQQSRVA